MRVKKALALAFVALILPGVALAHGDEDHGDKKKVVATDSGLIARTARAGDYEVMMKHPALEPLHEHSARLFVTSYATNEPVKNVTANLVIAAKGKEPVKVAAKPSPRAGEYELTLPALDAGAYSFSVTVKVGGTEPTANYGAVVIEVPAPAAIASDLASIWQVLPWLLGGLLLAVAGVMSYRVWHRRAILQPEI